MKIAERQNNKNLLQPSWIFTLHANETAYDGFNYNKFRDFSIDIFCTNFCNPYRLPTETSLANPLVKKPICRIY